MPKCFINSELELSNGTSHYKVTFEADDGYQEEQVYQCTEAELKEALTHFNDSHLGVGAIEVASAPRVLTVTSSKEAKAALKRISDKEV